MRSGAVLGEDDCPIEEVEVAAARLESSWPHFGDARLFCTGATGFLGRWLLSVLLYANRTRKLNLRVTVLTRHPEHFMRRYPGLSTDAALTVMRGDVRTFDFPKGRFSHLIHAATDTSAAADAHPIQLLDTIIDGTRRTMEFALAAGVSKILFTSSGAVYGPQPHDLDRIREDFGGGCPMTDPRSTYGQAKRLAEQLLTIYHKEFGLETKIARCFAFVGPGMRMDGHFAVANFIRDVIRGEQISIEGDGTPVRSYLYAADAAIWLLRILESGNPGEAYNVGSDQGLSIAELARETKLSLGSGAQISVHGVPVGAHRSRYVPNVSKAKQGLELEVWTPLDLAIQKTANWYRAVLAAGSTRAQEPIDSVGLQEASSGYASGRTFVVDIDGVIAGLTPGNDYSVAEPLEHTIGIVNRLYKKGHRIVLYTARGSATGIDWSALTREQLARWGVMYHELRFGKPAADYYVDDRLISISEFHRFAYEPEA